MTERKTVAQELAVKDGHDWEKLSPEMLNAYLHNAGLAIEERSRSPVDELNPQPVYTCLLCKDKAYIGEKPCSECNPVGLPADEVHPTWTEDQPQTKERVAAGMIEEEKTVAEAEALARMESEAKAEKLEELPEEKDDSNSGTQPDNKPAGSPDTGKPKQSKKPKAKKPAKKKSG